MRNALSAQALKERVDLREVVRRLWGEPRHTSPRYDVHEARWRPDGKNASFAVYATHFKDYGGAGQGGDVFAFLQEDQSISFIEALHWVDNYLGGTTPTTAPKTAPTSATSNNEPPPAAWQNAARAALERTQAYLWGDAPDAKRALNYLRTVRGLTDDTIRASGYGYNPRWTPVPGAEHDTNKTSRLAPGIIEPWWCDGALWALRVRCRVGNLAHALGVPDEQLKGKTGPKYLNLSGSRQTGAIYNGDCITPGGDVLVVEGGFDAQLAQQHLPGIAVVTFGSAANHPTGRRLKQLGTAGRVFLLLDSDEAGIAAQQKLCDALGSKAIPVRLPHSKDVTDFIAAGGDLTALLTETANTPIAAEAWWRDGVPDDWRSALLTYFRPVTAPVVELMNVAANRKLLNPSSFTVNDVLSANDELGFNISAGSVRRVMAELEDYFFAKLDPIQLNTPFGYKTENKSRGRTAHVYRLLPLSEVKHQIMLWIVPRVIERLHPTLPDDVPVLAVPTADMFVVAGFAEVEAERIAAQLRAAYPDAYPDERLQKHVSDEVGKVHHGLQSKMSTPLPQGWSLANGSDYRAAFLRATNDEKQRRSRREIRELIGVSNGSVGEMVRRAGLQRKEAHGEFETVALQHPQNVDRQVERAGYEVAGYPRAVVIDHPKGEQETLIYRGEQTHELMSEQIAAGAQVSVRFQVANHYVELNVIPPPKPKTDIPPRAAAPRRRRKSAFFAPMHDPVWVAGQLALLLVMLERFRYLPEKDAYLCVQSGEVYENPTVDVLLPLLL